MALLPARENKSKGTSSPMPDQIDGDASLDQKSTLLGNDSSDGLCSKTLDVKFCFFCIYL